VAQFSVGANRNSLEASLEQAVVCRDEKVTLGGHRTSHMQCVKPRDAMRLKHLCLNYNFGRDHHQTIRQFAPLKNGSLVFWIGILAALEVKDR
jgi:hypothetical protein